MTLPKAWIDLLLSNYNNDRFDTMSELTPVDVNLPDARAKGDAKNTNNPLTQNQIKPWYDSRWKTEFKLYNLSQIKPGSPKHSIWIGDLDPEFNPRTEKDVVKLEFSLKRALVNYLKSDDTLVDDKKRKLLQKGNVAFAVFGKMIFLSMADEGGEHER